METRKFTSRQRKWIITAGIVLFVGIGLQFTSPAFTNPPVTNEIAVPDEVLAIFQKACYDCHSNNSQPTWYDRIAPASYLVASDIREGRSRFNFSDWDKNPPAVRELLLWEMVNTIEQHKMPLALYTWAHPEAKLTATDLTTLKNYVNTLPGRHRVDTAAIMQPDASHTPVNTPVSTTGIAYPADYKNWTIISSTDKFDGGSMRVVYGNDIMVRAIEAHQLPFPDGATIVKVVWGKQPADSAGNVLPGNFQNVQVMVKDSKQYASTEGWGFAKFDGLQLKPYGKTADFAITCINCHRELVPDQDFVFNIPTK
ncbi:heme-binding domain-containing protein [Paraflavitalea pollutisoli]|uniref:heme-binding domain-containing protein n=1 Tax=Paraflavitalea pollutisoli TaxID=3034143 RepID=UPI0023EBFBFF|nr:heme-binding domain-containing protein [Paraflavitalea sp. H1-2-19X]